jgi:ABC-type transporter Mla MlaB component
MELEPGRSGGNVVVALRGELDLTDAANVTAAPGAVTALEPRIIVDLSGLEFIDAAGAAAQERAVRHQEVVTGQLQVTLNNRVTIGQARGVLAGRLRVTPDEAFVILRRYARDHNHPLTELSGDVIRGTARIAGDR